MALKKAIVESVLTNAWTDPDTTVTTATDDIYQIVVQVTIDH